MGGNHCHPTVVVARSAPIKRGRFRAAAEDVETDERKMFAGILRLRGGKWDSMCRPSNT
jgi:hypothetical protein